MTALPKYHHCQLAQETKKAWAAASHLLFQVNLQLAYKVELAPWHGPNYKLSITEERKDRMAWLLNDSEQCQNLEEHFAWQIPLEEKALETWNISAVLALFTNT